MHPVDQAVGHGQQDQGADHRGQRDATEDGHGTGLADEGADEAGGIVGQGHEAEPGTHHQGGQAQRSQLGHHGEADGGEAELAQGVEQIGADQPEHGGLDGLITALLQHGTDHEQEADGEEQQAHGELHRGVRLFLAELDPDGGDYGSQGDDEEGVQGLEPGGRHFEAADHAIGIFLCIQVHQATGLLEAGPEDDGEQTQHQDDLDAVYFLLGQRGLLLLGALLGGALGGRHAADVTEEALGHGGLYHQGEQHADTGADEGGLPAVGGGSSATDYTGQQGTQVDAHVEDGEGAVTTVITSLIQVAHHGGDVRLEQAVTHDQQAEARVEDGVDHVREHGVGQSQGELAGGHEHGTKQDGAALT